VRGATTHYDAVVGAATSGVLNASTDTGVSCVREGGGAVGMLLLLGVAKPMLALRTAPVVEQRAIE
jgi:hypothetical protein